MFKAIGNALGISAGTAFGGVASALGGLYQNQEAKRAAKRQMEFQAEMSNTGYQRAMADMREAGLNPILAGKLGPASSPAGAMYQPGNIGQGFVQGTQAMSSARQSEQQTSKFEQEMAIAAEVHGERWERLFASMGPENVLASVQAVLAGVSVKQVLTNAQPKTHINTRAALEEFVTMVRANKNWIASNVSGFTDTINKYLPEGSKLTPETVQKMIGAK